MDLQTAAQLPESFSHASDSNPRCASQGHLELLFGWYAFASILDFYADLAVRNNNANGGCRASGMAMNIGETLLNSPKNRGFRFSRQPLKIRGDLQIHSNLATLGEPVNVPAERRRQPSPI